MSEQSNKFKYTPSPNKNGYISVSYPDFFKYYSKYLPEKTKIKDYNLCRKILEFIFKRIWFYMITELWIFKAPCQMGMFYISENPNTKGVYKDWVKSKQKGKLVYKYSFLTNGRKPFIKWDKSYYNTINKSCYAFQAFRGDKDTLEGYRGLWGYIKRLAQDPLKKDFRGHIL